VVGVDSYGQASAPAQPTPQTRSIGQPPTTIPPVAPTAPVNVAPPTNLPPSAVPQGPPPAPAQQEQSPMFQ
jgi:hypothetical protein